MSNIIVLRDGNEVASATLGFSRPDVTSAFPDAPLDTGFQASLDTAKVLQCHTFAHGKRKINVNGAVTILPTVQVTISN